MRILFVSNSFPNILSISTNPSIGGTQRRLDLFVAALSELGELDVLFYVPSGVDTSSETTAQVEQELSTYWNTPIHLTLCPQFTLPRWQQRIEGVFDFAKQAAFLKTRGSTQIQAFENCLQRKPDLIFVQRLQSIYPILTTLAPLPPVFYDIDDVEHLKKLRDLQQLSFLKKALSYLEFPALQRGEYQAIRCSHLAFVCSEQDKQYLAARANFANLEIAPNAISIPPVQPITSEPTLLLLGSFHYPPNTDAANFLIEEVLPLIRRSRPDTKLIVAGINPHHIRSYATGAENVEFTGFVDDLDALYARARIACCPIFSGGGTRIKMIEAAAYGKPIIATTIGAEGLEMQPEQDFLLANSAQEFAEACLQLLENEQRCQQLGTSARAFVTQHYDVAAISQHIQQHIRSRLLMQTDFASILTSATDHENCIHR